MYLFNDAEREREFCGVEHTKCSFFYIVAPEIFCLVHTCTVAPGATLLENDRTPGSWTLDPHVFIVVRVVSCCL